jgi:hypothetical protein
MTDNPPADAMREALEPFAKIADDYDAAEQRRIRTHTDEGRAPGAPLADYHRVSIALGDCRNARLALALFAEMDRDGPGTDLIEDGITAWIESFPTDAEIMDGVIEECAKVADKFIQDCYNRGDELAQAQIRAAIVMQRDILALKSAPVKQEGK